MRSIAFTGVTAASLIALCGQVQAETQADPASAAPAAAASELQLEEVIVTAQKRSENVLDVAISITPVSAEQLEQTASKNLEELQGVVPGVTFPAATAYGGSSMVIRGTSGSGTFLEDDPVAVYVDGVYQASNSRFGVSDLTDIQSVEVVRGPQGTLQGRNATAGAILVRTADPSSTLDGFVTASVENPTGYRVQGAVSLPLFDSLRVRLSADHFDEEGWARNLYNGDRLGGEKATNTRAVILWEPVAAFSARLALNYQNLTNTQASQRWAQTAVNPTGVAENLAAPTPFVSLPTSLQNYYLDNKVVYNNVTSENTQRSPSAALEIHYNFGPAELVSLTGVSSASNLGQANSGGMPAAGSNGVSLIDAVTGEDRRAYNQGYITGSQLTEELRLQSTATAPFKWLAGAYGSHAIDDFTFNIYDYNLASNPPGDANVRFKAHQRDESVAAFVDATYNITSRLSLTGGLRYTDEYKLFDNTFSVIGLGIPVFVCTNFIPGGVPVPTGCIVSGPLHYAPPQTSWTNTSYRANVAYKITDDSMVYVSNSRGFKSGGFNAFGVGPQPSYNPELLYSTEIGAKSYILDRRGYVTASIYDNRYNNLQVTAGVPTGGVIIYNAATARIDGFEVEANGRLTNTLSATANVAYTHARYTQFQNGQGVDGNLINASGNALPNSPRWQYYLQGDYKVPLTSTWEGHAQVSYRWRDKVYFFGTNQNANLTGGVDGELGARFEATYNPGQFTVSLYGRNLTDTRVVNGEQVNFAYPVAFFNTPRVLALQLSKKF